MATEYKIWVFGADPLMKDYDSATFNDQAVLIVKTLSEAAKDGWRVVGQSALSKTESGFGIQREERQELHTGLRIVYTLARDR